jgi:hypothetical protein
MTLKKQLVWGMEHTLCTLKLEEYDRLLAWGDFTFRYGNQTFTTAILIIYMRHVRRT